VTPLFLCKNTNRRKPLPVNNLGRAARPRRDLSPYVATTYDDFLFLENNLFLLKKNA